MPDTSLQVFTVSTDQADYAPDSTAYFTAANTTVGGAVNFMVSHLDPGADGLYGTADDLLLSDISNARVLWTVVDGGPGDLDGIANGIVERTWQVGLDAANQTFGLSAIDVGSGQTAEILFTDSPPPATVDVTGQNSSASANGVVFSNTTSAISTGTGVFTTFLMIQHNKTEQG